MTFLESVQILGSIGELIGAIAVVVTLVYLARQLRQNTASVGANAYQTWVGSNLQINMATAQQGLSEVVGRGIYDSSNLSPDTFVQFALWNHSFFQLVQATDFLHQSGAIDHALWKSEISRAAGHLGLPGVRQWWDAGGKTQLTPDFVTLLESSQSDIVRWAWNQEQGYVPDPASLPADDSSKEQIG